MAKRIVRDQMEEEEVKRRRNDYLFTCPKCGRKDRTEYAGVRHWTTITDVGTRLSHKALTYDCKCGVTYEVDIHPTTGDILGWEDLNETSH